MFKKKNYKDLLIYTQKLIEIDRLENEYNYQLAYAFEISNNLSDAIKYYKKYLDKNGKSKKQAFNNIGCIYLKKTNQLLLSIFFYKV